ncbi:MAG: protecting protein DprA protein [candidate division TM6 bacterium GW2011_GWF2_38_10]|nr:MAG: protecting protein DprA protein [candidate division TM6 bacterium GW2011_GWF2_38_10]
MIESNRQTLLHLSLINGVGPGTIINKIIKGLYTQKYPDLLDASFMDAVDIQHELQLDTIYSFTPSDFMTICGLTERLASLIVSELKEKKALDLECSLIEKHTIRLLTIFDRTYPEILKQIATPPVVLYCKGATFEGTAKRMAIVGSRNADQYAQDVINNIIPDLVTNGWEIVSGGAEGVDAMAHQAAHQAGGKTLIVLGSGLLKPYPPSNFDLFKEVTAAQGTLISPFPLTQQPDKTTFPARNRIIAGLSQGCVVVRAASRSGALITAQYALDQGRQIFAVPGSIYDDISMGCHALIQQGAKLAQSSQDILEEFNETLIQTSFIPAYTEPTTPRHPTQTTISPILSFLSGSARTIDELCDKTGLSLNDLNNELFTLQLAGKIQQDFTGKWLRI